MFPIPPPKRDERKLTDEMKENLAKDHISLRPYNAIYEDVKELSSSVVILVDPARLNYALYNNLPKEAKVVEAMNPTVLMKAMKNDGTEMVLLLILFTMLSNKLTDSNLKISSGSFCS